MKLKHIALIGSLFPILFSIVLFFGVLISADSDDENSNFSSGITGMNLSAEVLKHQPMVEKYARENGISEYVNVLLAIIQVESGGTAEDVMQSSESLGLPPNSLDTESSIKQGCKYFASLLSSCKNQGIDDLNVAIQSYNYGGGYVGYVAGKGKKHTFNLAENFAREKSDGKKVTGWQMIEGALYCFDNKGIMQRSGWVAKDDGKAYLTDEGKALTGWQTINEKEYYFDSKGIVATGEVKIGLEKCKFNEKGELISKEKVAIDPKKPMIALTFDDGPGPRTSELLNQLKKYNAHATFFMLGKNVKLYPDAVKQMLKDGNELGNHSYDHQQLTKIDGAAVKKEVDDTNRNIKNICGSPATLLRPPYGAINDTVKSNVGMPMILWNVDTLDRKTRNTQSTIDSVMKNLKDGDIVLMHDIHSQTIDAALELIPKLEEEGYQLVTVSEMAAAKKQDLKDGTAYSDFTN